MTSGPMDQKLFLFCHDNCIRIVTTEGGGGPEVILLYEESISVDIFITLIDFDG